MLEISENIKVILLLPIIQNQIESRKRALLGKKDINRHILKHLSSWFDIEEMDNNYRFTEKEK